jgi:hypothetical protein
MTLPIPTEEAEQIAVVHYLLLRNIPFWHTPNSTYTKSWSVKNRNTRLGVQAGIPDLFVIIKNKLYGIEMKRRKGGVISLEQSSWIATLNRSGVPTIVARGADEAIEFINKTLAQSFNL